MSVHRTSSAAHYGKQIGRSIGLSQVPFSAFRLAVQKGQYRRARVGATLDELRSRRAAPPVAVIGAVVKVAEFGCITGLMKLVPVRQDLFSQYRCVQCGHAFLAKRIHTTC